MPKPIKLIIVDDSAVVRQTLSNIFKTSSEIDVIGVYSNPIFAIKSLEDEWPDVFILDIEMPQMDGITFLKTIMKTRPTPVIICSSLTPRGATTTLEALAAGAVEIVTKPNSGLKEHLSYIGKEMINSVKMAAQAKVVSAENEAVDHDKLLNTATKLSKQQENMAMHSTTDNMVAIGTSTGGTQALEKILTKLPVTVPAIVIVQHMPEAFTKAFAERLDKLCQIKVKEAVDNERILPGHAYIAPGGLHMQIRRQGAYYYTIVKDGPPVSRHKPSVNVLFGSVAKQAGKNATGIILTGMGEDGAHGLLDMRKSGARTIAQDEKSSVVFGMPKEAIKIDAASSVESLTDIAKIVAQTKAPTLLKELPS